MEDMRRRLKQSSRHVRSLLLAMLVILSSNLVANRVDARSTHVEFCNRSAAPIYVVIYGHNGGLFPKPKTQGWARLTRSGKCLKEVLYDYELRSYGFAAIDKNGDFVELKLKFNGPNRPFRGAIKEVCIPVQKELKGFTNRSQQTPPCAPGWVALAMSRNVLGGNEGEVFKHYLTYPSPLPAPMQEYAHQLGRDAGPSVVQPKKYKPFYTYKPKPKTKPKSKPLPMPKVKAVPTPPEKGGFIDKNFGGSGGPRDNATRMIYENQQLRERCAADGTLPMCVDFSAWEELNAARDAHTKAKIRYVRECSRQGTRTGSKSECEQMAKKRDALEATFDREAITDLEEKLVKFLK